VTKLSKNEVLMLNIGSMCTGARVLAVNHLSSHCSAPKTPQPLQHLHGHCVMTC